MKVDRSISVSAEAYAVLVRLAEEQEAREGRFVALGKVATRLILEAAGQRIEEPTMPRRNLLRAKRYLANVR